jgi:hypothetical protein
MDAYVRHLRSLPSGLVHGVLQVELLAHRVQLGYHGAQRSIFFSLGAESVRFCFGGQH